MTSPRYVNIAIGSTSGAGATTLLHALKPRGLYGLSTGQIMRKLASSTDDVHNPLAENLSPLIHRQTDERVHELLASGEPCIIEGWLAGFVARDIPHTLKVLVTLSDHDLKVQRFAKREGISLEQAEHYIKERDEKNMTFWKKMYGTDSFWEPDMYDMVVDTAYLSPEEEAQLVLERFNSSVL